MGARKKRAAPQLTEAIRLLRLLLADGPKLARDCVAWLHAMGISKATIARAYDELLVVPVGARGPGSRAVWALDQTLSFPRRVTGKSHRTCLLTLEADRFGIDCLCWSSPSLRGSRPDPRQVRDIFEDVFRYGFRRRFIVRRKVLANPEPGKHPFMLKFTPDDPDSTTIAGVQIFYGAEDSKTPVFQVFMNAAHQVLLDLDEVDLVIRHVEQAVQPLFGDIRTPLLSMSYVEAAWDSSISWASLFDVLPHAPVPRNSILLHWSRQGVRIGSRDGDFDAWYEKVEDGLTWLRIESKRRGPYLKKHGIINLRDLRAKADLLFRPTLPAPFEERLQDAIRAFQRGQNVRQLSNRIPSQAVRIPTRLNRFAVNQSAETEAVRTRIIKAMNRAERRRARKKDATEPPIFTRAWRWQYLAPSTTLARVYAGIDPGAVDIMNVRAVRAHFASVLLPLYAAFINREGHAEWPTIVAVFDAAVQAGNTWAQATRDATKARRRMQEYQQLVTAALGLATSTRPAAAPGAVSTAAGAAAGTRVPVTNTIHRIPAIGAAA